MGLIWNSDSVAINDTVSAKFHDMQLVVSGVGMKNAIPFTYQATVTSGGWYVTIISWGGPRKGEFQGNTFNLPLEVATAANRLL